MCEHTCCCILFIVMNGVDPNSKVIWNVFENGFEIKEKKEKKIRKIKVF